jgi:hypothetical protein
MPWGFDGLGDGKFVCPPGYEFDVSLEDTVEELNLVPKPHIATANIMTILCKGRGGIDMIIHMRTSIV